MSVQTKLNFLAQPHFAVVGASKDQTKFGTKILKWYQRRGLDVTPVHPKETELEGVPTVRSVTDLPSPATTAVSIVTPAKITLGVLETMLADPSIAYVWIQPGAADATVSDFIEKNGLGARVVYGGPCLLVEGDELRNLL